APSETALRAFALPISDPDQRPLEPGLRLPGRIDFAPHLDADRLAIATDAGSLSVFGYGNARKGLPLFRLFKDDLILDASGAEAGRALIAHADADSFWVADAGKRVPIGEAASASLLLTHHSGAYLLRWAVSPPTLTVQPVGADGEPVGAHPALPLPAAVAGPPALGQDSLIVPLENGL